MEQKFYLCKHCRNIATKMNDSGVAMVCCGEEMKELRPGTSDGAHEKHVPVYTVEGNSVSVMVGSAVHPMLPEHYIQWIALKTTNGMQVKWLKPGEEPKASFALAEGETVEAVYEYCNLHLLWKA